MHSTSRAASAVAALALSISPVLLSAPAMAEPIVDVPTAVSQERDVGGAAEAVRRQQQAYLDQLATAARRAEATAAPAFAPGQAEADAVPVSVATLLTIGGLAVGAGATLALRRVQLPGRRQVAV